MIGSDPDGDVLTFYIETQPTHGSLGEIIRIEDTTASVNYIPGGNYYGTDTFTFKTHDGELASNIATVSITITNVNDPPSAPNLINPSNDAVFATQTPELEIENARDPDNDLLTYNLKVFDNAQMVGEPITKVEQLLEQNIDGHTRWIVNISLAGDKTYYWQAQANDGKTNGEWSNISNFTIKIDSGNGGGGSGDSGLGK